MASDVVLAGWLAAWWWQAVRARHGLRFLNPLAFTALRALAEVLIDGPRRGGRRTARWRATSTATWRGSRRPGKQRVQLALTVLAVFPLLTLRLPFAAMSPERRLRYLQRRFIDDVVERRVLRPLRPFVQAMIRLASQMTYLGYYGDARSWKSVGYQPFSEREGGRLPAKEDRPEPRLRSLSAVARRGRSTRSSSARARAARSSPTGWRRRAAGARARARPARRPGRVHRGRGRAVPAPLQRGRAAAGDRLPAAGAAGDVRRRRHDDQQRGLLRPARRRARALGAARAGPGAACATAVARGARAGSRSRGSRRG